MLRYKSLGGPCWLAASVLVLTMGCHSTTQRLANLPGMGWMDRTADVANLTAGEEVVLPPPSAAATPTNLSQENKPPDSQIMRTAGTTSPGQYPTTQYPELPAASGTPAANAGYQTGPYAMANGQASGPSEGAGNFQPAGSNQSAAMPATGAAPAADSPNGFYPQEYPASGVENASGAPAASTWNSGAQATGPDGVATVGHVEDMSSPPDYAVQQAGAEMASSTNDRATAWPESQLDANAGYDAAAAPGTSSMAGARSVYETPADPVSQPWRPGSTSDFEGLPAAQTAAGEDSRDSQWR